jgi:TonB family protein
VLRRADPTGTLFGPEDRLTVLRVRLSPEGELLGSTVDRSSGVGTLDDEVTEAFKKAQSFPKPPRDLVGSDDEIVFRFGFCYDHNWARPQEEDAGAAVDAVGGG